MEEATDFEPRYRLRPVDNLSIHRIRLTEEGLHRLEHELEDLEAHELPDMAERIRDIKATSSDLAESGEYASALEDLAQLQARAALVRGMIGSGEVVRRRRGARGSVQLGSRVTVDVDDGRETYEIVGAAEADALTGRISEESPLAQAVLGHRAGDLVEWRAPVGVLHARVVEVA